MATKEQDNKQGGKSGSQQSDNTSKRGFASMDPEQQREIAAEGGRAAHEKGTAHEFTSEEARRAGAMSHKNDPGRSSGGSRGSANPNEEEDKDESSSGKGSRSRK